MARKKLQLANNPLLSGPSLETRAASGIPYREVSISAIETDPNQPRVNFDEDRLVELADSIRSYGIMSPLLVRPGKFPGKFILIAGERRFRAAKKVGLATVPVLVNHDKDDSNETTLAMQLVENLQRSDLTPLERAHAISALKETNNLSVREVAAKLGVSKSMVQRSLDILDLPDDLLNALREGASESKVLLLSKIADDELRATYLKDLDVLTRSKLKTELESVSGKTTSANNRVVSPEDRRIAEEIQRAIGLKVSLSRNGTDNEKGRISIEFYSEQDLQVIFRRLVESAE
ncbi:MAG: ParB/RepB/Spo0J family partition protein [Bdellovibrionales bacterium]|nr:ParB/RepB/Spo0J family partition protein [Bdellovibrionales bacterium]